MVKVKEVNVEMTTYMLSLSMNRNNLFSVDKLEIIRRQYFLEKLRMSLFKQASHGEILRAAQKDSSFTDNLQRNVSHLCLELVGPRVWLKYKWLLEPTTRFFYYMITTGLDLQTLGEEYTGIIQVQHGQKKLPSKMIRFVIDFNDMTLL